MRIPKISFGDHTVMAAAAACLMIAVTALSGCSTQASSGYFGRTEPPENNVLRYVSGPEPETLDPALAASQGDIRILLGFFEGLVEYHPKTMEPIPALAEKWEVSPDGTTYTFHIRNNAKFSDGTPLTAEDIVFSFRRAISPELASKNAGLAFYIKNAEAFNAGKGFVYDDQGRVLSQNGEFVSSESESKLLAVPENAAEREKSFAQSPKILALIGENRFEKIGGEKIGVSAAGANIVKIELEQPAPYFIGLLAHPFFRVVPAAAIKKHGDRWTRVENMITSGAYVPDKHHPYDVLSIKQNPHYWDRENVGLKEIRFYPIDEQSTMMNLYRTGDIDAIYNHTVPASWNSTMREYRDEYLLHPEAAIEFFIFNTTTPPFDDERVRKAFSLAIDRRAYARFRRTVKPLTDITPENIFPAYETVRKRIYAEEIVKQKLPADHIDRQMFDAERARQYLKEAGYAVERTDNGFLCADFPANKVSATYNTAGSNKAVAEFLQAQWKQNLGITVMLENMETKTFIPVRKDLAYRGIARGGWAADHMDPFAFLGMFHSKLDQSDTGWKDPEYDRMIDEANRTLDETKRFELLAKAEFYVMQKQIVIPLATAGTNWLKKPYVKGMYPNAGTLHPWKFVRIEREPNAWDKDVDRIME